MGTPVDRRRMDGSDSAFLAFPKKGEGATASSANQPGKPEGVVLPWLMTMPLPSEAMNIGTRPNENGSNCRLFNFRSMLSRGVV
jgi:hypothetical protein